MTLYRYEAFAEDGKKIQGIIDADSYELAKDRLRRQQVLLIDLFQVKSGSKEIFLDPKQLLAFTREMQLLLRAGLPVYESLVTIEEKYKRTKVHSLFLDLCDRLKHGHLLSSALKNYPKTFDEIYLCLIRAGEQTGELAFVFEELYLLISRKQKLKKQLVSSLAYPAFLGAFCLIVLFSMLFFVVPSMKELFEGRTLHPLTETVLWLSGALVNNIFLIGSFLGVAVTALVVLSRREEGKSFIQNLLLKMPFTRNLILHSALIRFSRALSILLKGGVPLLKSIDLARKVLHLVSLEIFMHEVMKKISEGKSFSSEIKHEQIPSMISRMLKTAEDTGRMPEMLQSIAEIYEEELEKNLQYLTTFLQPVLLIFLGATVGIILLSILLPLTDVSSFLSS